MQGAFISMLHNATRVVRWPPPDQDVPDDIAALVATGGVSVIMFTSTAPVVDAMHNVPLAACPLHAYVCTTMSLTLVRSRDPGGKKSSRLTARKAAMISCVIGFSPNRGVLISCTICAR